MFAWIDFVQNQYRKNEICSSCRKVRYKGYIVLIRLQYAEHAVASGLQECGH
ncbi:uncharacterized protein A4U43_C03F4130, partial [Asparagus officinalis]